MLPILPLLLLFATPAAATPPAAPASGAPRKTGAPEVAPGTVARWSGGADLCEQDGHPFPALDGACYFAFDLGAEGTIAVARRQAGAWERRSVRIGAYPYPTQAITGVDERYVAPSKVDLERVRRDQRHAARAFARRTPRRFALPLGAPLADLPPGGRFGARRTFNGEPRNPHGGADYPARAGVEVLSPADGTVALAEPQFFAGNAVFVDHGDGLISMAFHLSKLRVKAGDAVRRGEVLGEVGATGRVTGPHLHFAVRWRGARVDPAPLLAGDESLRELRFGD